MRHAKVLILDAMYYPLGGTLVIPGWTMQAMKDEYEVSLLSWDRADLGAINRTYGTSLRDSDFELLHAPSWLRALGETLRALDPDPWSILRWALLMRYASWIAPRYDVVISTLNEADLGGKGIQYVHYPNQGPRYAAQMARGRRRPWQVLAGFSYERMLRNRTIANSDWTCDQVRKFYGIECETIYPPGAGDFPHVAWEDREDGFVCIGRLEQDKRILEMIDLVARLRQRHPRAHLHVIGTPGASEVSERYIARLRAEAAARSDYVTLHERIPRAELADLIARHRYGLHAKVDEHFGCALAEMTSAGCIVFSHDSGGPPEILGHDRALLFRDDEDALAKIDAVMTDAAEQDRLHRMLSERASHWRPERFMREIRATVADFLAQRGQAATCS